MAVQIRELIVKANIDRAKQGGENNTVDDREKDRIKHEILEEVMEYVQEHIERNKLR